MFMCINSARHWQLLATMAFVRRFCRTSTRTRRSSVMLSDLGHQSVTKHPTCVATGNPAILISRGFHVYQGHSKRLNSGTCPESHPYRRVSNSASSTGGRSHCLHGDQRETYLMCFKLKDSVCCCSAGAHPSEDSLSNVGESKRELPVLFSIERGTVSHVLFMLTSSLPVRDGLTDVTATLRGLSTAMHVQSVYETAAIPWNAMCSDDIIIRNNQSIERPASDDIKGNQPIRKHDFSCQNQSPLDFGITQLNDSLNTPPTLSLHRHVCRARVYFNQVSHMPMAATIPEPNWLESSTDSHQPMTTKADPGTTEQEQNKKSQKPNKEQILVMYERLAQELPNFLNDAHDFSMYANTVEFDNRIMKFKLKGLPAYRASVHGLKYLSVAYLNGPSVEVLRITTELELGQIQARWRLKGVPLHSYLIRPWKRNHPDRYLDAFSTFELGADGLIHRHNMDKVMPTPSDKVRAPSLAMRVGIALGLLRNPALAPE